MANRISYAFAAVVLGAIGIAGTAGSLQAAEMIYRAEKPAVPSKPAPKSTVTQQPQSDPVPAPEPETPSLVGVWALSVSCATNGFESTMTLTEASADMVRGTTQRPHWSGVIFEGSVTDRTIFFRRAWTDIFGKKQINDWTGNVGPDGNLMSGTLVGGWAANCTWSATRK